MLQEKFNLNLSIKLSYLPKIISVPFQSRYVHYFLTSFFWFRCISANKFLKSTLCWSYVGIQIKSQSTETISCLQRLLIKAAKHVQSKHMHKHKHEKKYVWTGTTQAQSQAHGPSSHIRFLVLLLTFLLVLYMWTAYTCIMQHLNAFLSPLKK